MDMSKPTPIELAQLCEATKEISNLKGCEHIHDIARRASAWIDTNSQEAKRECLNPLLGGAPGSDSRCGQCEVCLDEKAKLSYKVRKGTNVEKAINALRSGRGGIGPANESTLLEYIERLEKFHSDAVEEFVRISRDNSNLLTAIADLKVKYVESQEEADLYARQSDNRREIAEGLQKSMLKWVREARLNHEEAERLKVDLDRDKCVAGCQRFTGSEVTHHEDCPHYPESLTRMHKEELENYKDMYRLILAGNESCPCCFGDLKDLKKHADASPSCPIAILAKSGKAKD